jgi:hypothetical protein
MKTSDHVKDKTGQDWTVVAVFSDGMVLVERLRTRTPADPPEVCGGLIAALKPKAELTLVGGK